MPASKIDSLKPNNQVITKIRSDGAAPSHPMQHADSNP